MGNIHVLLGKNIRELRAARNISLRQFSLMTGIDKTYLSGVENGKRNVTVSTLQKIALGLGTSVDVLFRDPNKSDNAN